MTIRGKCRTNLDDWKNVAWPDRFAFPPRVGDYVQGRGDAPRTMPTLKVHMVTHYVDRDGLPCVEVELHK